MQMNGDKTQENLERWCSTQGRDIESGAAEKAYKRRAGRIADVVQLKVPDQVPIIPSFGTFPFSYSGLTGEEGVFETTRAFTAFSKALLEFQPDNCGGPMSVNGPIYEAIGYSPLLLPGRGISANAGVQFVEAEYVTAEDFYDHFLDDPSDFILRTFLPRVCNVMQPLKGLRPLHETFSYSLGLMTGVGQFNSPEILDMLEKLKRAGELAKAVGSEAASFEKFCIYKGFPPAAGGGCAAPYDVIGDYIRGTRGVMLDMYRCPEKLLKALDKLVPYLIDMGLQAKKRQGVFVGIPLHKYSEGFMSQAQFKTFFWPSLRKVMLGLIDEGLIPTPFFEGESTSRLEIIRDIPKGKAIYQFQNVNIYKAKEILGDVVCFKGNVPASLLCTGTPEQVGAYVKELIEVVGKGGGLIMNAGSVMDNAKFKNVKAMFDFTRKYGVYS